MSVDVSAGVRRAVEAPAVGSLPPVPPLAVRAAGMVTAAGFGLGAVGEVLTGRRRPHSEPVVGDVAVAETSAGAAAAGADYPPRALRTVAPFDAAAHLGRKGLRTLDRFTRLGLVASGEAIAELPGGLGSGADLDDTGVVLGTSTGSIATTTDVGRDTLVNEKPYMVDPAAFANSVMNTCAGQIAIRHGLRGVNATLSGGAISGMFAVRYARTALSRERARRLLVGAVEEVTARAAWAWHRTGALTADTPLGEGAVFLVVEPAGAADTRLELLACEVGYFGGGFGVGAGLRRCVDLALRRSGLSAADVTLLAPGSGGRSRLAMAERRAVATALGDLPELLDVVPALGEGYSASVLFQLAATMAVARPGAIGLITSIGEDGNAGALVVRLPGNP